MGGNIIASVARQPAVVLDSSQHNHILTLHSDHITSINPTAAVVERDYTTNTDFSLVFLGQLGIAMSQSLTQTLNLLSVKIAKHNGVNDLLISNQCFLLWFQWLSVDSVEIAIGALAENYFNVQVFQGVIVGSRLNTVAQTGKLRIINLNHAKALALVNPVVNI